MYILMWGFLTVDYLNDALQHALERSLQARRAGRLQSPLSDAEIERLRRILAEDLGRAPDAEGESVA